MTPPMQTKLVAPKSLDVAQPMPKLVVDVAATDDLSGISSIMAVAHGPNGQSVYACGSQWWPTKFAGPIGQGYALTGFETPGTYSFANDHAGDLLYMAGTLFSGSVDFGTYFPSTTVTITP
jgi:hypothetical protein